MNQFYLNDTYYSIVLIFLYQEYETGKKSQIQIILACVFKEKKINTDLFFMSLRD